MTWSIAFELCFLAIALCLLIGCTLPTLEKWIAGLVLVGQVTIVEGVVVQSHSVNSYAVLIWLALCLSSPILLSLSLAILHRRRSQFGVSAFPKFRQKSIRLYGMASLVVAVFLTMSVPLTEHSEQLALFVRIYSGVFCGCIGYFSCNVGGMYLKFAFRSAMRELPTDYAVLDQAYSELEAVFRNLDERILAGEDPLTLASTRVPAMLDERPPVVDSDDTVPSTKKPTACRSSSRS